MNARATPSRTSGETRARVAVACGGTGGHLFPGRAVGEELARRGAEVTLLISPKEVDRQATQGERRTEVVVLPGVALQRGRRLSFVLGFLRSLAAARRHFREHPPQAVLAMGGFTSAAPVITAKRWHAATFLHEANTIPGRANRWLARFVDEVFVGFEETQERFAHSRVTVTGMPVRPVFHNPHRASCRTALGLDPAAAVMAVIGGSQGAGALNRLMIETLPWLATVLPDWQFLHLTGPQDTEAVRAAYARCGRKAVVHSFFAEMELVLGAATFALSRAGASSLAELAAMRVPGVVVPYPSAVDNHQYFNALAYVRAGAARLLEQTQATPATLARLLAETAANPEVRMAMEVAMAGRHRPEATARVADRIWSQVCSPGTTGRWASPGGRAATQKRNQPAEKVQVRIITRQEPEQKSQASCT